MNPAPPGPAHPNPVEVTALSLSAAGRSVLAGCSLAVRPGETVGLAGRSGSGKTALAHALLGWTRPGIVRTGGTVLVDGLDPFEPAAARRLRGRTVTYLPQDCAAALPAQHRVGRILDRAARRAGVPRGDRAGHVAATLERMRLPPALARSFPHELSGGQARRVALAAALAAGSRLLVLDEPTAGLDPALVTDMLALLRPAAGTALLMISHDPEVIDRLADRRLLLTDGRLAEAGTGRDAPPPPAVPAPAVPVRHAHGSRVLAVEAVSGGHQGARVLRDLSLGLAEGECVAVTGPSGTGKSTLARMLAGTLVPDTGRLLLGGTPHPWAARLRSRRGRLAVAHVEQDARAALNPAEPLGAALERARLTAQRAGLRPPSVAGLLASVSVRPGHAERRPGELSGGERQRANLARALAACPRVLVCDEVTSALDRATERDILATLLRLRAEHGLAVVLITHSREVSAAADRRLVLADGVLVPAQPEGYGLPLSRPAGG
ncbi:ATP-binding cassette domain-containing protein [Streptomyces sp. RFCAC02]|uniref:ABC transporter ATP-binding protein n=1 Tax=Streptomyces sp. RFCAC02 TaxID=2499143 RepID=UPI00101F7356|nr:ATP-binding cassette domain-containing protein [Streptomyces sp. RFCAC02]